MARSITFVIEGDEDTQITITEQDDGTLLFEIEVLNPSDDSDLRALYFDFADEGLINDLTITGDDVTDFDAGNDSINGLGRGTSIKGEVGNKYGAFDAGNNSINGLGRGTSIKGEVGNKYGAFDVGVALGTSGTGNDTIQSTSFVLSHPDGLTLDYLSEVDFGLRINGEKLGAESTTAITADDDAFVVDEAVSVGGNLLTNDDAGLTVTDAAGLGLGTNGVTTAGGRSGTLTVLADGTMTFTADSYADLDDGQFDSFTFTYSVENADGSTDMAEATITINGVGGGGGLPPIIGVDDAYNNLFGDSPLEIVASGETFTGGDQQLIGGDLVFRFGITNTLVGDVGKLSNDGTFVGGNDELLGGNLVASSGFIFNILVGDASSVTGTGDSTGGADTIFGGDGAFLNTIIGDFGAISTTNAAATLTGGDDTIFSGAGADDNIWGDWKSASGFGTVIGGADTFVFGTGNGTDTINDFDVSNDVVRLDKINDPNNAGNLDAFTDLAALWVAEVGTGFAVLDFDGDSDVTTGDNQIVFNDIVDVGTFTAANFDFV